MRAAAPFACWAALVTLAAGLPGCAALGVPDSELPERPVALAYYDQETNRQRLEAMEEAQEAGSAPATPGRGVANVGDMASYLAGLLGGERDSQQSIDRRFPSRLAYLDPRTLEVALVPGARPGAIPRAVGPGGRRLMFTQIVGGRRQLFELDRETDEVRPLTHGPAVHPDGCYLPPDRYVFMRAEVEGERPISRIFMTAPGGGRAEPVSDGPNDYAPACAPDGSAVAWVENDRGERDMLVSRAPAVGGPVRVLGPGRDPAFSPDGEWMVYSAPSQGRWQLHRIRADGSGRRRTGASVLDEFQASFSPDGRLLLYMAHDGFYQKLYIRRFDGSGERIFLDAGGATSPIW